jgi:hypothetical protein
VWQCVFGFVHAHNCDVSRDVVGHVAWDVAWDVGGSVSWGFGGHVSREVGAMLL